VCGCVFVCVGVGVCVCYCMCRYMQKVDPLQPGGHFMYRQFNIQQLYVLPTQCIYVFCVDLRTNSDNFPI